MFFNTIQYFLFLPVVVVLYYATVPKYRWLVLLVSSCFFYMYFIPAYILCLFFLIAVDYLLAIKIDAAPTAGKKKLFLWLSIVSNFGLLFYFKYLGFFTEVANDIIFNNLNTPLKVSSDILPIGLSFHTFQSVSYVVDVYRGRQKPERHLGIYSCYVLFFPQMVAGPIERFSTLGNELKRPGAFRFAFLQKALPLFLIGLFYKAVIADNCGEYVNETYAAIGMQNRYNVLIAIGLFSVQIYADFFGYSLMAQASAKLFGIQLVDNFAFPFFSKNIVDFWKKWHLSLTDWFRDYVYIPLGGNRGNVLRYAFNIAVVFSLSGLWHGAGFNFVLWGALHALAYLLTTIVLKNSKLRLPAWLGYVGTFMLVSFIFVFFRNGSLAESQAILQQTMHNNGVPFANVPHFLLLNLVVIGIVEFFASKSLNYSIFLQKISKTMHVLLLFYLLFAVLTFSGVDNLPFIYFQF